MYRTDNKDIWRVFREHHYLSAEVNKASRFYVAYWDGVMVGMIAMLVYPSGTNKYGWRESRTVILPDFQGLSFGTRLREYVADKYLEDGLKFYVRTSHIRIRNHCANSPYWRATASNNKLSNPTSKTTKIGWWATDNKRTCGSYEYMGQDYVNKPHIYIHVDDNPNIDYDIMREDLRLLKEKYWVCVVTGEIKTPNRIEDICLELGIRTQLLYTTKKGVATMNSKYKDKKIITTWDKAFSDKVRRYYKI